MPGFDYETIPKLRFQGEFGVGLLIDSDIGDRGALRAGGQVKKCFVVQMDEKIRNFLHSKSAQESESSNNIFSTSNVDLHWF